MLSGVVYKVHKRAFSMKLQGGSKNPTVFLKFVTPVVILAQCRYTKIAQRIFKYSDIQYTTLILDKKTEQFDI